MGGRDTTAQTRQIRMRVGVPQKKVIPEHII